MQNGEELGPEVTADLACCPSPLEKCFAEPSELIQDYIMRARGTPLQSDINTVVKLKHVHCVTVAGGGHRTECKGFPSSVRIEHRPMRSQRMCTFL
jgi:hypothetical protein